MYKSRRHFVKYVSMKHMRLIDPCVSRSKKSKSMDKAKARRRA